jgi:hypothetical protein
VPACEQAGPCQPQRPVSSGHPNTRAHVVRGARRHANCCACVCRAATTRCVPHVHITSVTTTAQRPFTKSSKSRKCLKLLVAIQRGQDPIIIHLSGSSYDGCPPFQQFHNVDGAVSQSGLSAQEYQSAITEILRQHKARAAKPTNLVLWHDRDTAHIARATTEHLEEQKLTVMVLPARSPDLDPLDYGVFGPAKRRMARARATGGLGWDDACKAIIDDLRSNTATDAVVDQLSLRLQACIDVGGRHIEAQLKALKAGARKRGQRVG